MIRKQKSLAETSFIITTKSFKKFLDQKAQQRQSGNRTIQQNLKGDYNINYLSHRKTKLRNRYLSLCSKGDKVVPTRATERSASITDYAIGETNENVIYGEIFDLPTPSDRFAQILILATKLNATNKIKKQLYGKKKKNYSPTELRRSVEEKLA